VRVPLLVRFPPRVPAGARVAEPVSTLGVFATILDLAGLELPGRVHVGSLTPAIDDKAAGAPVIAERFVTGQTGGAKGPLLMRDRRYRTYRSGTKKLVVSSKGETFLFDLVLDPGETRDRAASMPDELARLQQELETWMQTLGLPPIDAALDVATAPEIDPAVRERLEALGYTD
jgi:arylsulfatase A-like enzyme